MYIAVSLDGYIARPNDDLNWLSIVEREGEDYGYAAFMQTIDTVIVGRRTFDKVLSMGVEAPYSDKRCYVVTNAPRESQHDYLTFYNGDLRALLQELRQTSGGHIFCDGGAQLAQQFMQLDAFDRYTVSVIPILLGDGIRLFADGRPEMRLKLLQSQAFDSGLVQLTYERIR